MVKLNLPPQVNSVAALPCESLMFNCTTFHSYMYAV